MKTAKIMDFWTFSDLSHFGVKVHFGAPKELPKRYYSVCFHLLGRKGTHFAKRGGFLLIFTKCINLAEFNELHIISWILTNTGPSAPPIAKGLQNHWNPIGIQWFWRPPPLQNAKLSENGEVSWFYQILMKSCEHREIPHFFVISLHFRWRMPPKPLKFL